MTHSGFNNVISDQNCPIDPLQSGETELKQSHTNTMTSPTSSLSVDATGKKHFPNLKA